MTNLTLLVLSAALSTNTSVLEVRGPGFSPQFSPAHDSVVVTNVPTVQMVIKVVWNEKTIFQTNTIPLETNTTRYVWGVAPLKPARQPLAARDAPVVSPSVQSPVPVVHSPESNTNQLQPGCCEPKEPDAPPPPLPPGAEKERK